MNGWTIRAEIAEAIIMARMLRIQSARGAYERNNGLVGDTFWNSLRDQWEWHAAQPDANLKAAIIPH